MRGYVAFVVLLTLLLSSTAYAQGAGTIAGVVKDSSGAVLPGVTVEASSAVLIEKARVAVTDSEGRYRLELLPSGTYTAKFSLSGFNTVSREGLEVLANVTTPGNAEMKVGEVTETITVTGESPIVDVQRAAQVRALTSEHFEAIPSGKTYANMAVLIPAVNFNATRQDVGGADGHAEQDNLTAHGSKATDTTLLLDGMKIGNMISTGDRSSLQQSPLLFDQVSVQFSGNLGESGSAAPQINSIIKSGGNTFHTTFYVDAAGSGVQSSNITQVIIDRSAPGRVAAQRIYQLRDFNGAVGGPIVRNRVWFFTNARYFANGQYVPNNFFLSNVGSPIPVRDTSQQAYDDFHTRDNSVRVTVAASSNQKLSFFYDNQEKCNCHYFVERNWSPDATSRAIFPVNLFQATWTYTATNKLLFEAGVSPSVTPWSAPPQPGSEGNIPIVDTGFQYRNLSNGFGFAGHDNALKQISYRASGSYVTGSHSVKVGWDMMQGSSKLDVHLLGGGQQYNFVNGVPSSVTIYAPIDPGAEYRLNYNMGLFAQDQWTVNRMTASLALRVDMQRESVSELTVGPSKWAPNRNRTFAAVNGVPDWKDLNPRLGVSYDLFGNGKTALKASASRGVQQETVGTVQQVSPLGVFGATSTSALRSWNDNGNFVPDCNLADLTTTPGYVNGECGPINNANFALGNAAAVGSNLDPQYVKGWGNRPYDWEFSASVQQELRPRVSLNAGYFRRVSGNFVVTDNLALTKDNYAEFKVVVPNDPRLPGAGQQTLTVRDVNVVIPANNLVTTTSNLGLNQIAHWNGVDVGVDARLRGSLLLQGGVSTGKTTTDNCAVARALPESGVNTPLEFCHNETPFLTNVKALASYALPWGVRASAAFQNIAVASAITATVNYPTTTALSSSVPSIATQLGRPYNGGATANVNVVTPNSMYNDRLNQLDLKISKMVKVSRASLQLSVDVFNLFNANAILNQNTAYGSPFVISPQGTWLSPTSLLQGRFAKFGARIDF